MSKKVLIISSSPRKDGNSELLCKRFMEGAMEAGHSCELVSLREKKLSPCVACDACRKNGGTCVIPDDANEIGEKMLTADVIVLATPVYFFTMSAQLKMLIDRCRPRYRKMEGKEFYFIATVSVPEEELLERTFDSIRGFLDCMKDPVERGCIYGNDCWLPGDVKETPAYNEAYEMGKAV